MDVKEGALVGEEVCKCYEKIANLWLRTIPLDMVKYLLDYYALEVRNNNGDKNSEACQVFEKYGISEISMDYYSNAKGIGFTSFQKSVWEKIKPQTDKVDTLEGFREIINQDSFLERLPNLLLHCEAFFDVKEFDILGCGKNYEEEILNKMEVKDEKRGNEEGAEAEKNVGSEEEEDTEPSESATEKTIFIGRNAVLKRELFQIKLSDNSDHFQSELKETRVNNINYKLLLLYNGFKEYYKALHRMLKEGLQQRILVEKDLMWKCKLDACSLENRKIIQQCLRVTDSEVSLTGLVHYVEIQDCISDPYTFILREQRIKKLTLVDTCGLDHVNVYSKNEIKHLLEESAYISKEKKIENFENVSVLYIKKLDSGKPDELRTIIPVVREVFPAVPLYCLFSGIDIFYRTPEEIASLNWRGGDVSNPKAIKYIFSDKFREENDIDKNMYLVMKNNLVPFCGKSKKIKESYEIYQNNYKYVRNLFASVAMKEYSSLEIVDENFLDKLITTLEEGKSDSGCLSEEENCMLDIVRKIIKKTFEYASLDARSYRYNTKQADLKSFSRSGRMGYWGIYPHWLKHLFHYGYAMAISENSQNMEAYSDLPDNATWKKQAVIAGMKNMEGRFFGPWDDLIKVVKERKGPFREVLDELLLEKEPKLYEEEFAKQLTNENRDELFNRVFQFAEGLQGKRGELRVEQLVKHFLNCLKEQLAEDNRVKAKNIFLLNADFKDAFHHFENSFYQKYSVNGKNEEVKNKLYRILNYYFSEE